MDEQIQANLEIIRANEEAYLNELVAYQLHFEVYKYDRLTGKLVEVPINVSWNEHVVTIIKELKPIRGRTKLTIVSCTLLCP